MQVKILKKTENELRMEIQGEGHTFCNLLQDALLQDGKVEIAGYDLPHPLIQASVVYVRVKKGYSPEEALKKALRRIEEDASRFLEEFRSAAGKLHGPVREPGQDTER